MNDLNAQHSPRPEFRLSLERNIVGTLRRETRFGAYYRIVRNARIRTAALLVIGTAFGLGCSFASAQVHDARSQAVQIQLAELQLSGAKLRLELAQQTYAQNLRLSEAGVITKREVTASLLDAKDSEMKLRRAQINLEEVRVSSASPRDELFAPLINGRDFVKERLELQAAAAQARLADAEALVRDNDSRFRAGLITNAELAASQNTLLKAQGALESAARQLELRREFFDKKLKVEDIARAQQLEEVERSVRELDAAVKNANTRWNLAKSRQQIGMADEFDVKRAEVDLMEAQLELTKANAMLNALRIKKKE